MSQQEQEIVWMIKGVIAELPDTQRSKVTEAYGKIKATMSETWQWLSSVPNWQQRPRISLCD